MSKLPDDEMTNEDVLAMIADLRGGIPEKCDFCGQPGQMTPEEGGLWACMKCWNRWEEEDARQRAELEAEEAAHEGSTTL